MAHSGRERHRDRDGDRREWDEPVKSTRRVFRITEAERQEVAQALRYIDESRRSLIEQQNPANREIIRELRASADKIFELMNGLEETE